VDRISAFIPAAGLGERLRPITDHIPKPLLPVLGRPMIEIVLERVSALSPQTVAINMHHCWEQIQAFAESSVYSKVIQLYHEDPILGTGGALKNAYASLKNSAFIVYNADILSDIDLPALIRKHEASRNIATLAVQDNSKFNNVWIDREGIMHHVGSMLPGGNHGLCKIAFTGIAVYSPAFLDFLPEGPSSVVDSWLRAVAAGNTIGTMDFSGSEWTDIGTPDAYARAVFDALKKQGKTIYAHASVDCGKAELQGTVVIEQGTSVNDNAFIRNSVLLPGSHASSDSRIDHGIIGQGFSVDISPEDIFGTVSLTSSLLKTCGYFDDRVNATCIVTGGSDRTYYRIRCGKTTYVLMACREDDKDYERHLALSRFFQKHEVPVPRMIGIDEGEKQAIFEDLGDLSLYAWLACRRNHVQKEALYRKILDIMVMLHTSVTAYSSECPTLLSRLFDQEHLLWESGYFMERFVRDLRSAAPSEQDLLNEEFKRLAVVVDAFDKVILHRDFQSQNIMIVHGDEPRIIDFQGARMGPPAYDVASLLWDPYHCIETSIRDILLTYYISRMNEASTAFDADAFRATLLPCRLQRHMQALGAYGFLSLQRGKEYFLMHVPQALDYLKQETEQAREDYPALYRLVAGFS